MNGKLFRHQLFTYYAILEQKEFEKATLQFRARDERRNAEVLEEFPAAKFEMLEGTDIFKLAARAKIVEIGKAGK